MATNTVSIDFKGDTSDLKAKLTQLQGQLNRLGTSASGAKGGMTGLGNSFSSMVGKASALTAGFIGISSAIRLVRSSIETLSQFGFTMSQVEAISGASGEALDAMRDKAREMGATTMFSATQAAEGLKFLSMAGFSAKESTDALASTLHLAQAGSLELGRAADIMSNIMSAFAISASDASKVADDMATTAASANTDIQQLGDAFKYAGATAKAMGFSMADSSAAIGVLSNAGLQASMAGTGLRMFMVRLSTQSDKTSEALERMGLSMDEVNPEKVGLNEAMRRLADAGLGGSEAIAIFGVKGAAAALTLTSNMGAYDELREKLANNEGAAKSMAETMENNLHGAIMIAKSAFQELILQTGDQGLGGALRGIVEKFTAYIQLLNGSLSPMDKNFEAAQRIKDIMEKLKIAVIAFFGVWAFGKVTAGLTAIGTIVMALRAKIIGMTASTATGMATATAATTAFKAALISTGVGALVVALGSIVAWSTTWGDESQRNETHLRRIKKHYEDIAKNRTDMGFDKEGDASKKDFEEAKPVEIKALKNIESREELDAIIKELESKVAKDKAQIPKIKKAVEEAEIAADDIAHNWFSSYEDTGRMYATDAQMPIKGQESAQGFARRGAREARTVEARLKANQKTLDVYRGEGVGFVEQRAEEKRKAEISEKMSASLKREGQESIRRFNIERGIVKELTEEEKIKQRIADIDKEMVSVNKKSAEQRKQIQETEEAGGTVKQEEVDTFFKLLDAERERLRIAKQQQTVALEDEQKRLDAVEAGKKAKEDKKVASEAARRVREAEKASASIGGAGGVSSLAMIGGGGGVGAMMSEAERQAVVQDKIAKTNERTAIATEAIAKALAQGGNGKEPITATYI